jgi:hypothetical protein
MKLFRKKRTRACNVVARDDGTWAYVIHDVDGAPRLVVLEDPEGNRTVVNVGPYMSERSPKATRGFTPEDEREILEAAEKALRIHEATFLQ